MNKFLIALLASASLSACAPFNTPFGVVGGDEAAKEFFGPIKTIDEAKTIFGSDGRVTGTLSDGSKLYEWIQVKGPKLHCLYVRMRASPTGQITYKSWQNCGAYY